MPLTDPLSRRSFLAHAVAGAAFIGAARPPAIKRYLYVATPGIRDYLQYGGHGVLVFAIDDGHKFVRRIASGGKDPAGKPRNVKGICASARTARLYVSTTHTLTCHDLRTDAILWEKSYDGGCDRMSIVPNESDIYLPSFEGPFWNVVSASDGSVVAKITLNSGAHNTVYGPKGDGVYLAGLKSPLLTVADPRTRAADHAVGPFSAAIRPFTVDGAETRVYACVNGLLGFEVGDLTRRTLLKRVEVAGFRQGPVARHGCPSHGIGLTPDGRQLWVCDAFNRKLHLFDATDFRFLQSLSVRDEPGWITFSIDGTLAYPSTGEVFDVKSRSIVATLSDEAGRAVHSEKLLEIDFDGADPLQAGDQFGRGNPPAPTP